MSVKKLYPQIGNFRELIDFSVNNYKGNIAYKYKKMSEKGAVEVVEKTYEDVGNDVKALSTALLERGYAGKRIAIIGSNRYEWVIGYFSILSAGIVAAPMDKLLPGVEIESLIQRSSVDAIIFEKGYLEIVKAIREKDTNNLNMLICMEDIEDNDVVCLKSLIKEGNSLLNQGNDLYEKVEINNNEMSIMLFTSGTTDKSKIVMLSQNNILSNVRAYTTHIRLSQKDTLLSVLPIHHTFECSITITYGFYCGATVAFSDGIKYIADNLKEYKITVLVAVPLLIENMCKKIKRAIEINGKTKSVEKMMRISNALLKVHIDIRKKIFKPILKNFGEDLRLIFYGAAPIDKDTVQYITNLGLKTLQGYGLTETSPALCGESDAVQCVGTAGIPLNNVQIKILNPGEDGVGDIVVKGPNVFLGYYEDKEKTEKAFTDGWFNTGDLGYINEDGFLVITGRRSDIIVLSNGKNIYPEELEMLIDKLSYVKECMVFPSGKGKTDTLLVAKIVYDDEQMKELFPGRAVEEYEEIIWEDIDKINKNLPLFKNIKQIIVTGKELSKTTTQKIKRFQEINKIQDKEKQVPVQNETEQAILECIKIVLDDKDINVETNFFEAGGDSLSAIDLQIELSKIDIDMNTQEIYDNPTARKIYNYVIESKQTNKSAELVKVDIESEIVEQKSKNNILLTGATGFLGIHILKELIQSTENNVYCIIRQSGDTLPEARLKAKYQYYFENDDIESLINTRIFVIKGDISKSNFDMDENSYNNLVNNIDIVINSAASVSHYGDRQSSYRSNVLSVDNILEFATKGGALINHISTTGLAGNNLVNTNDCIKDTYSEEDLKIGQKYEQNVYLATKLEAEEHIIQKIKSKEVHANILRVGNLMNRYSDNVFQENKDTNAFQNKIKELMKLGAVPKEIINFSFDLTPVDLCAKAVVKLSLYESYNNVYHVLNSHELKFEDIAKILKQLNIDLKIVEMQDMLANRKISKWLINDFLLKNKRKIIIDSQKTQQTLEKLNFKWDIDNQYYTKVFVSMGTFLFDTKM